MSGPDLFTKEAYDGLSAKGVKDEDLRRDPPREPIQYVDPETGRPKPVSAHLRPKRVILCRSCGHPTGIRGAAFCDGCRSERVSDELMSEEDWDREVEIGRPGKPDNFVSIYPTSNPRSTTTS